MATSSWINILFVVGGFIIANTNGHLQMENPYLVGGDMLGIEFSNDRNAIINEAQYWPGGIIPYVLDPEIENDIMNVYLNNAMLVISKNSCIRFVKRTTEEDYVKIFSGKGCSSYVGRKGGEQLLSLGPGCNYFGTVTHVLLHAVGFYHEQNRSDRDEYIDIKWENIKEGLSGNFFKLAPHQNQLLTPFDYDSIMLYGSYTFSRQWGKLMTMVGKHGRELRDVINKHHASKDDWTRVNTLYKCKK